MKFSTFVRRTYRKVIYSRHRGRTGQRVNWVEKLGRMHATGWAGVRPLFVLSTGRTGTKTLAEILNLSPDIHAVHEGAPRLLRLSLLAFQERAKKDSSDRFWDAVVETARAEAVAEAHSRGKLYAETNNRLTYFAPTLARFFPQARFVLLHRHPVDVIRSGVARGWYVDHPWDWTRITPTSEDVMATRWPTLEQSEKIAWYWDRVNRFALEFLSTLPPDRWMRLSAELLFSAPGPSSKLFEFMEVTPASTRSVERVLNRSLNATPAVKRHIPQLDVRALEGIRQICGKTASELGYTPLPSTRSFRSL